MKKLATILSLLALNVFADQSAMRGWYYYDDPKPVEVQVESQVPAGYSSYREFNEAVKREFEEVQDRAIYNPTPENIQAYNEALRTISNNAVRFGMLTVTQNWQDPNSGMSVAAPNGAGLQLDLDKQRQQIAQIVKRYAIFYFIGKDCKYCSVEANELKRLEYTYNVTVRVISLDGSTLPQYPKPTPDNGISKKLAVRAPGELMAFDSSNNKTTVLGFGYIHFDQLIQRLQTLFITGTANWDEYLTQKQPVLLDRDNQ
jgi:conjugal transfer pilus assembly protein TraF